MKALVDASSSVSPSEARYAGRSHGLRGSARGRRRPRFWLARLRRIPATRRGRPDRFRGRALLASAGRASLRRCSPTAGSRCRPTGRRRRGVIAAWASVTTAWSRSTGGPASVPVSCKVAAGMRVAASRRCVSPGPRDLADLAALPRRSICRRETDVAVVGAGPGGLAAASRRAEGAEVIVLDERPAPGGQYYKQPAVARLLARDRQFRDGAALIERVAAAGASDRVRNARSGARSAATDGAGEVGPARRRRIGSPSAAGHCDRRVRASRYRSRLDAARRDDHGCVPDAAAQL